MIRLLLSEVRFLRKLAMALTDLIGRRGLLCFGRDVRTVDVARFVGHMAAGHRPT